MVNLLNNRADACAVETFQCGNCGKDYEAKIITWVGVTVKIDPGTAAFERGRKIGASGQGSISSSVYTACHRMSRLGIGEERLRKMLRFLKEDPLMIGIREKLTEAFFGDERRARRSFALAPLCYLLSNVQRGPLGSVLRGMRQGIPGSSAQWVRMSAAQRKTASPRLNTNKKLERKNREYGLRALRFGCATGSKQKIAHCGAPSPERVSGY